MIFTTKAEYGVRLLVQLGLGGGRQPLSLKAIAEAESLPLAYLERIAALLKKAGMVEATRGAHGGYMLARPAAEITMDQVVLALEGHIAPMDCFLDDRDGRVLCSHHDDARRARGLRPRQGRTSTHRHHWRSWPTSRSRTCTSRRVTSRSSRASTCT